MIELTVQIAEQLIEIIENEDQKRIILDEMDKFRQGRCVVISGPSNWSSSCKGNFALIYICLDARTSGVLQEFKTQKGAIKEAKRIIKKLETV